MSEFSSRVASLTPEQRRRLGQRLREQRGETPAHAPASDDTAAAATGFSLFFFSADGSKAGPAKYRFLLESARFADERGFEAVWIPERHFDAFGGLYPSPSVLAAALALTTERIRIRAGSVVLPLQQPVRVAEEWSVIDNLSNGRVGISFASGWHPNDFVLSPGTWPDRKGFMLREIETVQRLWAGESVTLQNGVGAEVSTRIYPAPVQPRLPLWITSASNSETWVRAAELGANVLTALLEQTVEETAEKIALYRRTLADHGYAPDSRRVTMMLHTFVGSDLDEVRETVRPPMTRYLRSHMSLYEKRARTEELGVDVDSFSEADREALVAFAFERYFGGSALFGTPETCVTMVERLRAIGVDEIAALIDFGVDEQVALGSLEQLDELRRRFDAAPEGE
jgi:natural product biosynthesis luciferase-like monooxygenase protein